MMYACKLYVSIDACMYLYIHVHIYVCIMCVCVCVCVCVCARARAHMRVFMFVSYDLRCVPTYICMHACRPYALCRHA